MGILFFSVVLLATFLTFTIQELIFIRFKLDFIDLWRILIFRKCEIE